MQTPARALAAPVSPNENADTTARRLERRKARTETHRRMPVHGAIISPFWSEINHACRSSSTAMPRRPQRSTPRRQGTRRRSGAGFQPRAPPARARRRRIDRRSRHEPARSLHRPHRAGVPRERRHTSGGRTDAAIAKWFVQQRVHAKHDREIGGAAGHVRGGPRTTATRRRARPRSRNAGPPAPATPPAAPPGSESWRPGRHPGCLVGGPALLLDPGATASPSAMSSAPVRTLRGSRKRQIKRMPGITQSMFGVVPQVAQGPGRSTSLVSPRNPA